MMIITIIRISLISFFILFASQPLQLVNISQDNLSLPISTIISLILFCSILLTHLPYTYITNKKKHINDFNINSSIHSAIDKLNTPIIIILALILFTDQNITFGWMICIILIYMIIAILLQFTTKNIVTAWICKATACIHITGIILIYLYLILLSSANTISRIIMNLFYENVVYNVATIYSINTIDTNSIFPFVTIIICIMMISAICSFFYSIYKLTFYYKVK